MDKEASPTQGDGMDFGWALAAMRNGEKVTRRAWARWEQAPRVVWLQQPGEHGPQQEYLCKTDARGQCVVYTVTNESVLARDWQWA